MQIFCRYFCYHKINTITDRISAADGLLVHSPRAHICLKTLKWHSKNYILRVPFFLITIRSYCKVKTTRCDNNIV